jgi:hypothetical protein
MNKRKSVGLVALGLTVFFGGYAVGQVNRSAEQQELFDAYTKVRVNGYKIVDIQ